MTTDTDPSDDDPEVTAAERAIGVKLLRPGDLESAPVALWSARLSALFELLPEVRPGDHVWRAVAQRIDRIARSELDTIRSARRSLWRWRATAIAAMALVATCLAIILGPLRSFLFSREQPYIATLGPNNVSPILTAVFDPNQDTLTLAPVNGPMSGANSPQLWFVPSQGAPISLGIIDLSRQAEVHLPRGMPLRLRGDGALAISLEPPGGSPSAAPTGPIVAQGHLKALP
jgi:anti-sigma-K factor RskA